MCISSSDRQRGLWEWIHPIAQQDKSNTLYQKDVKTAISISPRSVHLMCGLYKLSTTIVQEIVMLVDFDASHKSTIEKELPDHWVQVFRAFQPRVSAEENSK